MNEARFTTAKDALAYTMAGNATITLCSATSGARFTYRVRKGDESNGHPPVHFVHALTGANNEGDFQYLGFVKAGSYVHGKAKARISADAKSAVAFAWFFAQAQAGHLHPNLEVWHEGRCGRCHRKLTVPSSIASGLGPDCAGFVADAPFPRKFA